MSITLLILKFVAINVINILKNVNIFFNEVVFVDQIHFIEFDIDLVVHHVDSYYKNTVR